MRSLSIIVAALVVLPVAARAESFRTYVSEAGNPNSNLIGLHLDRAPGQGVPHGISMDLDGAPVWDTLALDTEWADLILGFSHALQAPTFRMRGDTAQVEIGQAARHPNAPFQLHLIAGHARSPLGGLGIASYGEQPSLFLYNQKAGTLRTNLNFFNLFAWGTDSTGSGDADFWVQNYQNRTRPLLISRDDRITLDGALAHTGDQAGFLGAPPIPKPTVTGSLQDGSALAQLLTQLGRLGLAEDATEP